MTTQNLPKKLKKEPLVDTVFEIRFSPPTSSTTSASNVLPGFFFAKLEPKVSSVKTFPNAQIPIQIRNLDPNLRYQPLMVIDWSDFRILIGDTTLGVSCKMPYLGWLTFREQIVKVINFFAEANITDAIERYALKCVNVIEGKNLAEQIQRINIDIRVGRHVVKEEPFNVRIEIPHENFINVIQIAAPTIVNLPNIERNGVLVDIDTICNYKTTDLGQFTKELPSYLESIHIENKKNFFDCLKEETINYLEPVYD